MRIHGNGDPGEIITVIGSNMAEITDIFRAQGFAERDFTIVGRVDRHRFFRVSVEVAEGMFDGEPQIAATYQRRSA